MNSRQKGSSQSITDNSQDDSSCPCVGERTKPEQLDLNLSHKLSLLSLALRVSPGCDSGTAKNFRQIRK